MQITRDKAALANSKQLRLWQPQNPFTPYSVSRALVHRLQGHESLVLSSGSSRNYWFLHLFSFFPFYVFMYVQMCRYITAHVHRGLKIILGSFYLFWDKVSHGLGGHQLGWASGHWALGWSCFCTPAQSIWIINIGHFVYHFYTSSGHSIQVLVLARHACALLIEPWLQPCFCSSPEDSWEGVNEEA